MKGDSQSLMTYLTRTQIRRLVKIVLLSGIALFVCAIIFVLLVMVLEEGERWKTSRHLSEAREEFNAQRAVIDQIIQGTVVKENLVSPGVPEIYFHHCIFASAIRMYGTNRIYEQVITDYITAFTQSGWTYDYNPRFENSHSFYIWIEPDPSVRPTPPGGHYASYRHWVSITLKSPEPDSSNDFLTYYEVHYSYRYPKHAACIP
jgi:hypothetical protein